MHQIKQLLSLSFFIFSGLITLGQTTNNCNCPQPPAICYLNLVNDFGATPENAQSAFEKAALVINKRGGYAELTIPSGNYFVGKQSVVNNNLTLLKDEPVFELINCVNVTIKGIGATKPILKFYNKLFFGMFDDVCMKPYNNQSSQYSAHAGYMFSLKNNSSNINIENLELDGNVDNFILGGPYGLGGNPYERAHDGLYIEDSHEITVTNVEIKNFGRDGIIILDNKLSNINIVVRNITLNNVHVTYSGRNGLSWCGGENLNATNCSFSKTGKSTIKTNPGAGIDIEPERGSYCRYGNFTNCIIEDNSGNGLTIAGELVATGRIVADITFTNSKLIGITMPSALTTNVRALNFISCEIYGTFHSGYFADVTNNDEATHFWDCSFSDCYNSTPAINGSYLILLESKLAIMHNCTVKSYFGSCYLIGPPPLGPDQCYGDNEKTLIQYSKFYCYMDPLIYGTNAGLSGNTIFNTNEFYSKPPVSFVLGITESGRCNLVGLNYFNNIEDVPICGTPFPPITNKSSIKTSSSNTVDKNSIANSILIYPNPVKEKINIYSGFPLKNVTVSLVDIFGNRLQTKKISEFIKFNSIDVSKNIKPGFYIVDIKSDTFNVSKKIEIIGN